MLAQRFASASKPDAVTHVYQRPLTRPRSTTRSWPLRERVERVERMLRVVAERRGRSRCPRRSARPRAGGRCRPRRRRPRRRGRRRRTRRDRGPRRRRRGRASSARRVRATRAARRRPRPRARSSSGRSLRVRPRPATGIDDHGPRHGRKLANCSADAGSVRTQRRDVHDRRGATRSAADAGARRDRHGRQRSVGAAARV